MNVPSEAPGTPPSSRPDRDATACVFAPSPLLTITVEQATDDTPEVHLHAGGQGFWIARMLVALGLETDLCMPLGGEVGSVLEALIASEGVHVRVGTTTRGNGAYVHDRRGGEREPVADMAPAVLSRHEVDELYSATLAAGLAADVTVLGGPARPDVVPSDVYRRLAADLRAVGRTVVADLSGEALTEAVQGGVTVLKVSHDDLVEDGRADSEDPRALTEAMQKLAEEGAKHVVVSRAGDPTIAWLDGELMEVETPQMQRVDHRGAGDSMTAGLATALARGQSIGDALRLGAAAGTSNVTRRGLATGHRRVVEQLAEHIVIRPLELPRS
ncbi:MAG TPA: PfkB family carbohydrate kinase [Nocardioidaceae bacterium]|nr:PfkB family carbohydrate kinase [Nocardioidaceae bacterium]